MLSKSACQELIALALCVSHYCWMTVIANTVVNFDVRMRGVLPRRLYDMMGASEGIIGEECE